MTAPVTPDPSLPVVELSFDTISIYFRGMLHMRLRRSDLVALQSWHEGQQNYIIEYTFKNDAVLKTEYWDKAAWVHILKELGGIF